MKEIRNIIDVYDSIDFQKEKVALASVVNVEESSYRRIGARMLVRSNGEWVGGISGGCLEGDALRRSQSAIFKNETSRVVYDTMEDDQNQIGVGLGCNGKIEVLFTPIDCTDKNNEIEQLRQIVDSDRPQIMIKVIDCPKDSAYLGSIHLVQNGQKLGKIGSLNSKILQESIDQTTVKKKPQTFQLTNNDGQMIKILVEYIRPETRLIIIGDNYDILSMLNIAKELGWHSSVIGKAKKLSKEVYRLARQVVDYEDAEKLTINDYTAVLLMSHDYNRDRQLLPIFLEKQPAYLGMLGPKKRLLKMQSELGIDNLDNLSNFYSPTGLEIGAESPSEIALSIAAEIVASFRNKSGNSLRRKKGTIHNRD